MSSTETTRPWLVTGATGKLGGHVVRELARRVEPQNIVALRGRRPVVTPGVREVHIDLAAPAAVGDFIAALRPAVVLHLGAISAVDEAYRARDRATRINTDATAAIARATAAAGGRVVFTSTVMVFDGEKSFYDETDQPRPLSHYGRTKLDAEDILARHPDALTVRLPLLYGFPADGHDATFPRQIRALYERAPLRLFTDEFHSPLPLADAALTLIELARHPVTGLLHLAGPARLSRYELIEQCAHALGVNAPNLVRASRHELETDEPRPADMSMCDRRLRSLFPDLPCHPVRAATLRDDSADEIAAVPIIARIGATATHHESQPRRSSAHE